MTKDEIQIMFRIGAVVRQMNEDDPRFAAAVQQLSELKRTYVGDFMSGKRREPAPDGVDWRSACAYIAGIFQSMDAMQDERDHDNECARRRAVWEIVSNGVSNWYGRHGGA